MITYEVYCYTKKKQVGYVVHEFPLGRRDGALRGLADPRVMMIAALPYY